MGPDGWEEHTWMKFLTSCMEVLLSLAWLQTSSPGLGWITFTTRLQILHVVSKQLPRLKGKSMVVTYVSHSILTRS